MPFACSQHIPTSGQELEAYIWLSSKERSDSKGLRASESASYRQLGRGSGRMQCCAVVLTCSQQLLPVQLQGRPSGQGRAGQGWAQHCQQHHPHSGYVVMGRVPDMLPRASAWSPSTTSRPPLRAGRGSKMSSCGAAPPWPSSLPFVLLTLPSDGPASPALLKDATEPIPRDLELHKGLQLLCECPFLFPPVLLGSQLSFLIIITLMCHCIVLH